MMKGYELIRETTRKTISHSLSQNRRLKAQGATFQAFVDREPPSELIIHRNSQCHRWLASCQDCSGLQVTPFLDTASPLTVSRWLKARAAGPICVVWNL